MQRVEPSAPPPPAQQAHDDDAGEPPPPDDGGSESSDGEYDAALFSSARSHATQPSDAGSLGSNGSGSGGGSSTGWLGSVSDGSPSSSIQFGSARSSSTTTGSLRSASQLRASALGSPTDTRGQMLFEPLLAPPNAAELASRKSLSDAAAAGRG